MSKEKLTLVHRDSVQLKFHLSRLRFLPIFWVFVILLKLLTKLRPESTYLQYENYNIGLNDIVSLDDSPADLILITDHEQINFNETNNLDNIHQGNDFLGKVPC